MTIENIKREEIKKEDIPMGISPWYNHGVFLYALSLKQHSSASGRHFGRALPSSLAHVAHSSSAKKRLASMTGKDPPLSALTC